MLRFKDRREENQTFFRYGVMMSRMYDFPVYHELILEIVSACRQNPNRTTDDILNAFKMIELFTSRSTGGVNVAKNFDVIMSAFDHLYPNVKCGLRRKMYTHRRCINILSPLS